MAQAIKNFLAENLGGPVTKLATQQFSLDETPDLTGKVAVVTGGSEGIGYGVTHTLLKHNVDKVFILSRSEEVVRKAKAAVAEELGQDKADRTIWMQCDLTDWQRVKTVADSITGQTKRLDALINNAGLGAHTFGLDGHGIDRHMATNHFSPALLTSYLMPVMEATAAQGSTVRIVNVASNMHQAASKDTRFESLEELNHDIGPGALYGRSKLANILFARWFNRHVTQKGHPNLLMNATHPGFVSSRMSKDQVLEPYPIVGYGVSVLAEPIKKDQFEGAVSSVFAATVARDSGGFICPPAVPEPGSKQSQNDELAERLMKLTEEVLGEHMKGNDMGGLFSR